MGRPNRDNSLEDDKGFGLWSIAPPVFGG